MIGDKPKEEGAVDEGPLPDSPAGLSETVTMQEIEENERGRGFLNTLKDKEFQDGLSSRQTEMINNFLIKICRNCRFGRS